MFPTMEMAINHLPGYSTLFLIAMWIWGRIDARISGYFMAKYKPFPICEKPRFTSREDVSFIICTLDPPASFEACLIKWYYSHPLEIIIVTTKEHEQDVKSRVQSVWQVDEDRIKVIVSQKGKRAQMTAGLAVAKGSLIAFSDDHIRWGPKCLASLLACFEDPTVGAAAPQLNPYIPEFRQNAKVITPWEAAATKLTLRGSGGGWVTAMWAASRWCFVIGGPAGVYRASILQDPKFIEAFNNDEWRGTKLDVGEDTFISRWVPRMGYMIATQWTEDAVATRTVKQGPSFISQILRWERSSMQTFLRAMYEIPGFWSWNHKLVIWKTFERFVKGPIIPVHVVAWIFSFWYHKYLTAILAAFYIRQLLPGNMSFFAQYPYMVRHCWAVFFIDQLAYGIINPWVWLTSSDTTWKRGEEKVQRI